MRHAEGLVHGFLVLHNLEGEPLADGDLLQTARGDRVNTQLIFHFKDGSLHHETAIYSQRGRFRLLSYHLVQKGPAFKHPMEMSIQAGGNVTVRYSDNGEEKVASDHLNLPADVANGVILTLLKNIAPDAPQTTVGFVAATPKPRLVKLLITDQGEEPFSTGTAARKAVHYVVRVQIGGLAGKLADWLGKEPPDNHVWILTGPAPAFVKFEGPLFYGGPVWRIELVSPAWPHKPSTE